MSIYPNVTELLDINKVSGYLKNLTSKQIFVHFKLLIGDQPEEKVQASRLLPKVTSGIPDLCNHVEVYPHYKADEELKVVCTIIKLSTDKAKSYGTSTSTRKLKSKERKSAQNSRKLRLRLL